MEEKKTFVNELEEEFNSDEKIQLMGDLMKSIVKIAPVQSLRFVHTATEDPINRIERCIDVLTNEEKLDHDGFLNLVKDLCFSVITLKHNREALAEAYNTLKDEDDPPIGKSAKKVEEPKQETEDDDDDDRTK